jgi:hypothetical protein
MEKLTPTVRKSDRDWRIPKEEFLIRFQENFFDPYFDQHQSKIHELVEIAYHVISASHWNDHTFPGEISKSYRLSGWDYPRHLKGRLFSVVVRGEEMDLITTGNYGDIGRYIGYFEPYASSHEALDRDIKIQEEVRNAARNLVLSVRAQKRHQLDSFIPELYDPRPK